jgi:hypothetical protein
LRSFTHSYPCQVEELPILRFDVETWLLDNRADESTREAVTLTVHELVADALLSEGCDRVDVAGGFASGEVWLEVRADGAWHPLEVRGPRPVESRALVLSARELGFELVHKLMDEVRVVSGDGNQITVRAQRVYWPLPEADI